jgi:hypothetical protein
MFAWAEKQLERLSKTVAPEPTGAVHQFKEALASANSASALALLCSPNNAEPALDAHRAVLHNIKGSLPIHIAAEYGNVDVVQALIRDLGVSPQQMDAQGNTPLHYATSSQHPQAFHLVQFLVNEYHVSLSVRNNHGQTPYDVCSVNRTRQWLLPIQLQRETQECLDNGGVGLPPGIDMGGIKLSHTTHLAPPPRFVGPPPVTDTSNTVEMEYRTTNHQTPSGFLPPHYQVGIDTAIPPVGTQNHPGSLGLGSSVGVTSSLVTDPPTPVGQSPPFTVGSSSAPSSSGSITTNRTYAHTGYSSAALLPPTAKYRPDGFHSSSSDTALQEKYGHDKTVTGPPSGNAPKHIHVGPPPTTIQVNSLATSTHGTSIRGGGSTWNARPNMTHRYPVYSLESDPFHPQENSHHPNSYRTIPMSNQQPQFVQTTQYQVFNPYPPPNTDTQDSRHGPELFMHQLPPLPNFVLDPSFIPSATDEGSSGIHPSTGDLNLPPPPMMDVPLSPG